MSLVKKLFIPALLVGIPLLFFYKTFVFSLVPFPGDLLAGNYEPYSSEIKGVPHKGQGADVVRQIYPWKYFSIESLKKGELPLWNPYSFSGNPHLANLQSGVFYPVNILFFLMYFVDAWTIYIILQYVFSLSFAYLYLREIGLRKISSLFGGVAFSFCAFFTVWGEYGNVGHSLSFFPLVLFSAEKILKSQKWYWYLLLITSFSFSILSGYIQLSMYLSMLFLFYVLFHYLSFRKNLKIYLSLVLGFIAGLLLSAIQLLPLYELFSFSSRGAYTYSQLIEKLLPLQSIVTVLVPDFFGNPATNNYFLQGGSSLERASNIGVWPLVFAFFALFKRQKFYKTFFASAAAVAYITSLSIPPIAYIHSVGIPFLSTGVPTRALAIFAFSLSVLGAFGLDSFLSSEKNLLAGRQGKVLIRTVFTIVAVFVFLWLFTFAVKDPNLLISRRNLIIPSGVFITGAFLILLKIPKKITAVFFVLFTIFELFYSFQKFNSFAQKTYVYPETKVVEKIKKIQGIYRSWGYGSAYIQPNLQVIEKNYSTDGYDPLSIKRYAEFASASEDGKVKRNLSRTIAEIHGGYGVNALKDNFFRKRALDLLGVKYVLNKNTTLDSALDHFDLIWQEDDWQIYENPNVLPRIKLFGEYIISKDRNEIIRTLYDKNFDIHKSLILENNLPQKFNIKNDKDSQARAISYQPNKILVSTRSDKDQLLFISDNYFPGWKAEVDGENNPLLRANYSFKAIPIKAGKHEVEIYYSPLSFWLGFWISISTFVCLILIFLFATIKKRTS